LVGRCHIMRLTTGKMVIKPLITHSLTIIACWLTFVCLENLTLAGEVQGYWTEKSFQVRHFQPPLYAN